MALEEALELSCGEVEGEARQPWVCFPLLWGKSVYTASSHPDAGALTSLPLYLVVSSKVPDSSCKCGPAFYALP